MAKLTDKELERIPAAILSADSLFEKDEESAYLHIRRLLLEANERINASEINPVDIYIVSNEKNSSSSIALKNEGLRFFEHIHKDKDFGYGKFLSDLWKKQKGFILVEHDIIPWPGAIEELMWCNRPWCAYEYYHQPGHKLNSLGCVKFSDYIVQQNLELPKKEKWHKKYWSDLDGFVITKLIELHGHPHIHNPAVAHLHKWQE